MSALILALMIWAQPATVERHDELADIGAAIEAAAEYSGQDPWRLAALTVRESGVRLDRVGARGECGPGQVMGWFLDPPMTCEDLQTANGGMIGVIRMLDQWEKRRPKKDPWQCFASGNRCSAARSAAKLDRIANELRRSVE